MTQTKRHNEIVIQLDKFYIEAKRQILQNQSAITGLFPTSSAEKSDASIKTSLWAASSVFALYLAYSKRVDNDQGRAHDLGQSVVKCMRGILFAWMRQSERVESFKANQCPKHALHLKFDLHSGLANDFEYPHLQIDVVSLYLIFLANFIASGLDIIYCMDEVTFIQNLVYYVERAYRTPDYGNWEPGALELSAGDQLDSSTTSGAIGDANSHAPATGGADHQHPNHQHASGQRPPQAHMGPSAYSYSYSATHHSSTALNLHNAGGGANQQHQQQQAVNYHQAANSHKCVHCANEGQQLEIHATSIGMAKSALEAINGCNLFGGKGANWSIIYSDIDAHSRNRSIFETLLPRESRSRNTDSYLLATISWPCFATNDPLLYNSTKSKILRKLRGKYGLKRFLRDPYGTSLSDRAAQTGDGGAGSLASPALGEGGALDGAGSAGPPTRDASIGSAASAGAGNLSPLGEQPRAKQRKSSYFQRKNFFLANAAGGGSPCNSPPYQGPGAAPSSTTAATAAAAAATTATSSNQISSSSSIGSGGENLQRAESTSRMSKKFEHIESEWPLFICFLIIDGIFKQDMEQIHENEKLLYEKLLKIDETHGDYLMPKYYFVPPELVHSEKCHPDSVERIASNEGSSNEHLFITGQSILLITRLLLAGLLHPNELDPLRRHMPSHDRPKRIGRYSSFQATSPDLVVQTVLIAESIRLQAMMANYGIQTQTPREVEPVQIWSSAQLVKVYEYLGVNSKLGLRGRPARPIGALGTSKLYRICGQTIICYPLIFEVSDFYLAQDMLLLIDDIQNELNFIGRYWRMSGRPTVCIIIREEHLQDVHFRDLLDLLVQFKNGRLKKSGLRIKTGRLQNLISSSCIEHLDFLHLLPHEHLPQFKSFRQLVESPKQSLLLQTTSRSASLSVAKMRSQQQQQQLGASTSKGGGGGGAGNAPSSSKSRRIFCSASSNNLQAIEERANRARDDDDDGGGGDREEVDNGHHDDRNDDEGHHGHHYDDDDDEEDGDDDDGQGQDGEEEDDHGDDDDDGDNQEDRDERERERRARDAARPNSCANIARERGNTRRALRRRREMENERLRRFAEQLDFNLSDASMYKFNSIDLEQNYSTEPCNSIDYYECYKGAPTWPTITELLKTCAELSGQSQLLAILWEREGAKYCVDELTVEDRLERVSQMACQTRNWAVVRYCSSVLRRSVESLSPWLTSILVNGKQISLGTGPSERIINNPLTPTEIHTLIYSTASTKNPCDAVLQQEIALYIGRLISTRPDYFDGILTIRVANFMSAMRSYLNIKNNEKKAKLQQQQEEALARFEQEQEEERQRRAAQKQRLMGDRQQQQQQQASGQPDGLLDLRIKQEPEASTSEMQAHETPVSMGPPQAPAQQQVKTEDQGQQTQPQQQQQQQQQQLQTKHPFHSRYGRRCAQNLVARPLESLSPSDVRKLLVKVLSVDETMPISDRRQITGELCRVPKDFYDKVWSLLHSTNIGIVIGGRMLKSGPILTNMTQDDLNFALKVESILNSIDEPKLRQINVELLMALHNLFERNPEIRFDTEPLDLDRIIQLSLDKFRRDYQRDDFGLREFYTNTAQTAVLYTIRTVFDCLLPAKYRARADPLRLRGP